MNITTSMMSTISTLTAHQTPQANLTRTRIATLP